jgi:1-acyl-sn-glycerol-3-phosphate acyltransferase
MSFIDHDDKSLIQSSNKSLNVKLFTDAKRWNFKKKFFYTFVRLIVPRFFDKLFKIEVNGVEYLRNFPEGTPVIFCGNHKSHLDALIFTTAIAHPKRKLRNYVGFMVNGKAMNENFFFKQTKYLGGFPVYKDNPEPALNYAIETLKANLSIAIFPQGGRMSHSSVLSDYHNLTQEGRTGVGRIILRLNGKVPVLPFYIHGSENVLKIGSFMPRWGSKMSITFGKPIYFSEYTRTEWNSQSDEFFNSARLIVNTIMKNIWNLLKDVESTFLELLEKELGLPLDSIDENLYANKINKIYKKIKNFNHQDLYKFIYKK